MQKVKSLRTKGKKKKKCLHETHDQRKRSSDKGRLTKMETPTGPLMKVQKSQECAWVNQQSVFSTITLATTHPTTRMNGRPDVAGRKEQRVMTPIRKERKEKRVSVHANVRRARERKEDEGEDKSVSVCASVCSCVSSSFILCEV